MYICIHVCVYIYAYIYTCAHTHICVYIYIYIYVCVCIHIYIYIYIAYLGVQEGVRRGARLHEVLLASLLRPVHLLRVFLLRGLASNFPEDSLQNSTDMRIPTP